MDDYHKQAKKRLLSKIKIDTKTLCWNWIGYISKNGYGKIAYNQSTYTGFEAHRLSYILFKGKLNSTLQLDHLCRNRSCVNPDHLEEVTKKENIMRGIGIGVRNKAKTHCPQGHEYTPENTRISPANGGRCCNKCQRLHDQYKHVQKNAKVLLNAEVV